MKIVDIIPSFHPAYTYGGPIESTYKLCEQLALNGCEVRVLTTDANGPDEVLSIEKDREVKISERFHVRYCKRIAPDSISPTLLGLLFSYINWADVVHLTAVYSFPTVPTLFACKILGKPIVWSPRGALQRWENSTRLQIKSVWEWTCRIVLPPKLVLHVTSDEEAEETLGRFPSVKVVIIPNGVGIPNHVKHHENNGVLRLLFLGRLHPIKGVENLLEACSLLNTRSSLAWSLTIAGVGDPNYTETIRSLIKETGLSHQVKMVGEALGEVKKSLFENADIAILPSNKENFGIVIAEALAHGVPVIASKGTPWKRLEEVNCGVWADNNPDSLAMAMSKMSKMRLEEMGQRGREWMRKEFDWRLRAQQMVQTYERLVRCRS